MKCIVDDCDIPATHVVVDVEGEGKDANVIHPACTDHAMALTEIAAKGGSMTIHRIGERRGKGTP